MLTKKTKKSNTKTATKKGYDLNNIKTKKATQPQKKKNGALHLFFSLVGFVLVIGGLVSMFVPTMANAKQGVIIVESFTCKVALADLKELQRALEVTPRTDFKYKIFLDEYEAVVKSLNEHPECKELNDGK